MIGIYSRIVEVYTAVIRLQLALAQVAQERKNKKVAHFSPVSPTVPSAHAGKLIISYTTFVLGKLVLSPAESIKLRLSSAALTSASNIENL